MPDTCQIWLDSCGQSTKLLGFALVGRWSDGKMMTDLNGCRATVHYSGRVQGVGFRYAVKTLATGFDATGTVRNLPDGRVELVLEGERDELEAFLVAVRDSGLGPLIQDETCHWSEASGELRGFEIVR